MSAAPKPDCNACQHYYVTWEPSHPRGCRAYGFKSAQAPTAVVLASSGAPCSLFEAKTSKAQTPAASARKPPPQA